MVWTGAAWADTPANIDDGGIDGPDDFDTDNQAGEGRPRSHSAARPRDPLEKLYDQAESRNIDARSREQLRGSLSADDLLAEPPHGFEQWKLDEGWRQANHPLEGLGDDDYTFSDWRRRDENAFAPVGIGAGSFVFYPEIYSGLIVSNNLFAAENGAKSDWGGEVLPSLRAISNWSNHELELFAGGRFHRWVNFPSENSNEFELRARGRIDITRRTKLSGGLRYEQKMEGRNSIDLPDSATSPGKVHESELYGQFSHRFNRLGFRLRAGVVRSIYDDVALNNGLVQQNGWRDFDDRRLDLRLAYEFSPRLSVFADGGLGRRQYRIRWSPEGVKQGSDSWRWGLGAAIEFSPQLALDGRIGYARAMPDDSSLDELEGLIYDARLIWEPSRLAKLTLMALSEIGETTQSNSAGSLNHVITAELANDWTYRFSTRLAAQYEIRDYAGTHQRDRELTLQAGAGYIFSRAWRMDASYQRVMARGSSPHDEDRVQLGLKWLR